METDGNAYDGHTLKPQLELGNEPRGSKIKKVIVDKSYKVKGGIPRGDTIMPKMIKGENYYLKQK